MSEDTHIELSGIAKSYSGVEVLHGVDLRVRRGTVHALIGENGAGKSTLGKIIAGVIGPSRGHMAVNGGAVDYRSPRNALDDGLAIVDQELLLVPALTVRENVFLGNECRRWGLLRERTDQSRFTTIVERTGYLLDPDVPAGSLRVADQQKVEIMRAIARDASLIVMDEPTAALTPDESELLQKTIRSLRDEGVTIILVSHFLDEVLSVSDEITVLRDGSVVQTGPAADQSLDGLIFAMIGRELESTFPPKVQPRPDAPVALEVRGLTTDFIRDVSLSIRAGEIVGLAGLVGSGRTEVARAIFGVDPVRGGHTIVAGQQFPMNSSRGAMTAGIAMLPESRKKQGLVLGLSDRENVSLPSLGGLSTLGIVHRQLEAQRTEEALARAGVRGGTSGGPVGTLSGGNQQKVLFAKWLMRSPQVLVVDEPTRGVDIGAKQAIYELLINAAQEGMAILLISSELEEVLGLATRIFVMRDGAVVAELSDADLSPEQILKAAFGHEGSGDEYSVN